MKIGIVTYHRTLNYGACLQAVATRIVLERMGHKVYYVDYWPKYHEASYALFSFRRMKILPIKGALRYLFNSIRYYKYRKARRINFKLFFEHYIYPYCESTSSSFDRVIYGSDQIWRKQKALRDYNPFYFGVNSLKTDAHIAFSASMGTVPETEADKLKIKNFVSHLDRISVRENDLLFLLKELGVQNARLTLDPTLLLSKEEWDDCMSTPSYKRKKYVLIYSIGKPCFNLDYIRKYAQERNCIVKTLHSEAIGCNSVDHITTATPLEFIQLVRNAECVFTCSFHGLAFSIIYGKEFYASFDKNPSRAESLVSLLNLQERLVKPYQSLPYVNHIDYNKVYIILDTYKEDTLNYLRHI